MEAKNIFENRDNIIPIIGENSFFYYDENIGKIPLQHFLIDKIVENSGIKHTEGLPIYQMKNKGYFGLSLCKQLCFSNVGKFLKCYANVIRDYKEKIHLDETIKEFLLRYKFNVIITTSCFEFIEADLPMYKPKVYSAAKGANNKEELSSNDYTIYHIFGKCGNQTPWASDEEMLMNILHSHHNHDSAPEGLLRYIFSNKNSNAKLKSLLVLYSNLPDWLFRFFLYPLAYEETWSEGCGYYLNSTIKAEDSLRNFIEEVINYDIEEEKVNEILKDAITLCLPNKTNDNDERIKHYMKYDIFISYSSDDKKTAIKIKNILEELHSLNIWLDEDFIKDGSYTLKMQQGIENAAYFMPLITKSYKEKLNNKGYDINTPIEEILKDDGGSYVQKEAWAAAQQWEKIKTRIPQRKTYLLPILFNEAGITYDTIKHMYGGLKQLPESIFKNTKIHEYSEKLFTEEFWSKYKTIEKH